MYLQAQFRYNNVTIRHGNLRTRETERERLQCKHLEVPKAQKVGKKAETAVSRTYNKISAGFRQTSANKST